MQPNFQYSHINPEYNKNIQACVDWRFLVDIPNSGRILILYNQSIDFLFPIAQVYLPEMIISVIPSSGDYPLCTQLRFESTLTTLQGMLPTCQSVRIPSIWSLILMLLSKKMRFRPSFSV